jgi:outer membrane protein assembly complex protein YaeT
MRTRKRLLVVACSFLALLILAVLSVRISFVRSRIARFAEQYLLEQYQIRADLGSFDFQWNPFVLQIRNLRIYGGKENRQLFLAFPLVEIELPYSTLFSDDVFIHRIQMDRGSIHADNLPQPRLSRNTSRTGTLRIEQILVRNGSVSYTPYEVKNLELEASLNSNILRLVRLSARLLDCLVSVRGDLKLLAKPRYDLSYEVNGKAGPILQHFTKAISVNANFATFGTITGQAADYKVEGEFQADSVSVESTDSFQVAARYKTDAADKKKPYELDLNWTGLPFGLIRKLIPNLPAFETTGRGILKYSGSLNYWDGTGSIWTLFEPASSSKMALSGVLAGSLQDGRLELQGSSMELGRSRIFLSGTLGPSSFKIGVDGSFPRTADLAFFIPELRKIPGSYQLDAQIYGEYRHPALRATLIGKGEDLYLEARGEYLSGPELGKAMLEAEIGSKEISSYYPGASGKVTVKGVAEGKLASPVIEASVDATDIVMEGIPFGDISAQLTGDEKQIEIQGFLSKFSTVLNGLFRFHNKSFQINAKIQELRIEELRNALPEFLKSATGIVSGDVTASGNLDRWRETETVLTLDRSTLMQNDIEVVVSEGSMLKMENETLTIRLQTEVPNGKFSISGEVPIANKKSMNLEVNGNGDLGILNLVNKKIYAQGGFQLKAGIGGTLARPQYQGNFSIAEFQVGMKDPDLNFTGTNAHVGMVENKIAFGANGSWNGASTQLNGDLSLSGEPGTIALSIVSFPLHTLLGPSVAGLADITLTGNGKGVGPEHWKAEAIIRPRNVSIGETQLEAADPIQVELGDGVLHLKPVQLRAAEMLEFFASGSFHLATHEIQGLAEGKIELDILSRFVPQIQAGGTLNAKLKITGTQEVPAISGNVQVDSGALRVSGYPFLLEQIHLKAPVEKSEIVIQDFSARLGGGSISGTGKIELKDWQPGEITFQVSGDRIGTNYPEGLHSQSNIRLTLSGSDKDYRLGGEITVSQSSFREDLDAGTQLVDSLLSKRRLMAPAESVADLVKLDLRLQTKSDMLMDNNIVRAKAAAALQVLGTISNPKIAGRIQIRPESQFFYENPREKIAFTIRRGNLEFTGNPEQDPYLDVLATATLSRSTEDTTFDARQQDYSCRLTLTGYADSPEWEPNCSPTLSKPEFAVLLTTGDPQLQTAGALAFLGQQFGSILTGGFQRSVARTLGLTRFQIQPLLVASETNPGARLTLEKELGGGFDVTYSLSLATSTDQTWILDYQTIKNLGFRYIQQGDGTYTTSARQYLQFGAGGFESASSTSDEISGSRQTVESIALLNDSILSDELILRHLDVRPGDHYNFWNLQHTMEKIKIDLQKLGYLFPLVEVVERDSNGSVELTVHVSGREKREMIFAGDFTPDKEKYERWWRDGISEALVLEEIREDILRELWERGNYRAFIKLSQQARNGTEIYLFDVSSGPRFHETNLLLKGTTAISSKTLLNSLESFYFNRQEMFAEALYQFPEFSKKVMALYVERGFLTVTVREGQSNFDESTGLAEKEVLIHEGPQSRVASVKISGEESFPPELLDKLHLRQGEIFEPLSLRKDELTVREFFEEKGYRDVKVSATDVRIPENQDITIDYDLNKGNLSRVASIRITGNPRTRPGIIQDQISIHEGDIFTQNDLLQIQNNLYRLGLFELVSVLPQETGTNDEYAIVINLVESKNYEFFYGLRYDSELKQEGEAQISDLNLLGTGQAASFYVKANSTQQLYQFSLQSPSIFGWNWNAFFLASDEYVDFTFFNSQTTTFTFQQQYDLPGSFYLLADYSYRIGRTKDKNPGGPISRDSEIRTSRLIGTLLAEYRDDPFNPTRGLFFSTSVEYAPPFLGSDIRFIKNYNQFFYYKPLGRVLWASGVRVGIASAFGGLLIGSERFFTGGSNTLRGFNFNEVGPRSPVTGNFIGGDAVFILNQEIRFPVYRWIRGVAFYDAGNVYDSLQDFSLRNLRNSVGFGLRVYLPYGIVGRADLGFNLDPENDEDSYVFHFGIGQAF